MLRRKDYKWIRKCIALSLCMGFSLSGCGKQAETVTDYGTTSDTGENTSGSSARTEEKTGIEEDTGDASDISSGDWRKISEQLGGTQLTYEKDFSIGQMSAKISADYELNDSETLPVWRVHTITEDRIYEKEIVQNFFGDTASEVRREIGLNDARMAYNLCDEFFSANGGNDESGEVKLTFPAWVDEETCFLHTWEGKYNNSDYQLSIVWFSEEKEKRIAFGPKKWGEAIDMSSYERVGFVSKMDIGPGYDLTLGHDFNKLAAGMENHYQASNEEIESTLSSFLTGQLCLKQPSDVLYPKVKPRENAGLYQLAGNDDQPFELLFYRAGDVRSDRSDDYVLNGYLSCISEDLSGQSYIVLTQNGVFTKNEGSFYVTDHGVIAGSAKIYYDFEECLTDRTRLLSFESSMACLQENVSQELDMSKVTGNQLKIEQISFGYYLVPDSDKENEFYLLPVWSGWISCYNNGWMGVGNIIQNAVDGRTIVINYNTK